MYIKVNSGMENKKTSIFSSHNWSVYERLKFNIPGRTAEQRNTIWVLMNQCELLI